MVVYLDYLKDGSLEQFAAQHTSGGLEEGGDGKGVSHLLILVGVEVFSVMSCMLKSTSSLKHDASTSRLALS